eukprot:g73249.t1
MDLQIDVADDTDEDEAPQQVEPAAPPAPPAPSPPATCAHLCSDKPSADSFRSYLRLLPCKFHNGSWWQHRTGPAQNGSTGTVTPDWSDNFAVHRTFICDYDPFEPPFDVFDSWNSYADFANADTTLSPDICSHADTSNTDV